MLDMKPGLQEQILRADQHTAALWCVLHIQDKLR